MAKHSPASEDNMLKLHSSRALLVLQCSYKCPAGGPHPSSAGFPPPPSPAPPAKLEQPFIKPNVYPNLDHWLGCLQICGGRWPALGRPWLDKAEYLAGPLPRGVSYCSGLEAVQYSRHGGGGGSSSKRWVMAAHALKALLLPGVLTDEQRWGPPLSPPFRVVDTGVQKRRHQEVAVAGVVQIVRIL